ncbi:MAG: helix-turn-helix transcriptional regulator [Clostridia bacterium]|nr:helix-turn-helix transcriptional regulator [Clostridia bacterium]
MQLNSKKELTPVVFGETSVKILKTKIGPNIRTFEQHWHDRLELHLVKSGSLELCCNDKTIFVNTNELSIVSPTMLHSGKSGSEGYECYVIMFEVADLYNGTVSAKQYIEPIINGKIRFKYKTDNSEIVLLANQIVEMQQNSKNYHPLETVGRLYRLLGLLCEHCIDDTHSSPQLFESFDNVINYINLNFTKNISSASISRHFGYDEAYFCRRFKKITGITAMQYIRTQRLEHACTLLKKTKESIRHIALSCGFMDAAYFTNCFKSTYGISPLKYRNTINK